MQICNQVTYIDLDNTAREEAIPENIRLMSLERPVQKYIIIGLKYSLGAGINQGSGKAKIRSIVTRFSNWKRYFLSTTESRLALGAPVSLLR
jgi:hypothetical protein